MSALVSAGACAKDETARDQLVIASATGDHRFWVEVADDDEERRIGLMYRTSLPENAGMLFVYEGEPAERSMWMKNTLIPLDMAFIAADGRIVKIAADTTPRSLDSISSGAAAAAVLEVNGGRFEALGVKEGDVVHHAAFTP